MTAVGDIATAHWVDGLDVTGVAWRGQITYLDDRQVFMIDENRMRQFQTARKFITLVSDKEISSNPFAIKPPAREENPFMTIQNNPFAVTPATNPFAVR